MEKEHLVPASILAGCTIIAAGLFFGLREREAAPVPTQGGAAPQGVVVQGVSGEPAPPPPVTPGGPFPVPAMPQAPPAVQAATEEAARRALLAEKKATFLPRCYEPAIARAPEPRVVRFTINLTFDPQGREVSRGILEDRSAMRDDVANCLRGLTSPLEVSPPPGVPVRVELPLELP